MKFNYDGKRFRALSNSGSGQVSEATTFEYRQQDDLLWGTYQGGAIRLGTITGLVQEDGSLRFHYQHVDVGNVFRIGKCHSVPEYGPNGQLRLHEQWQWLNGDGSTGASLIEEIIA